MARYDETQGSGAADLIYGMAPFMAASYFQGTEAKIAASSSKVFGGRLGKLTKGQLGSMRNPKWLAARMTAQRGRIAGKIAAKHGVFKAAGWTAAKRAAVGGTVARIAASRAAGIFMMGFNAYLFAPLIYSGVKGAVNSLREVGRDSRRMEFGGDYVDTRGAYTERQRSLRAITSSRMSTRAALGNEAILMHR